MKKTDNELSPVGCADLLCVLREIEETKQKLNGLFEKRDELKRLESASKRRNIRAGEKARNMTVLKMALGGKSHAEIAGFLGLVPHDMTHHIAKAWKVEFPKHYAASEQRIKEMGRMTALKLSPPILPHNDQGHGRRAVAGTQEDG